jgi:hypothetical protein
MREDGDVSYHLKPLYSVMMHSMIYVFIGSRNDGWKAIQSSSFFLEFFKGISYILF